MRFRVSGRVQGVAYRASAVDAAVHEGCVGWVRNLPTGDVEGLVQGEASAVDGFLAWAAKGPAGARVDRLLTDDEEVADDFSRFEIRR
ncbi:MAG TPA: acylphosphatase [Polyangia bacterium]|nr:acylphosphatase [Polyangia bacterium]